MSLLAAYQENLQTASAPMVVPLAGTNSLFARLGHIIAIAQTINNYRGVVIPGKIATLVAGDTFTVAVSNSRNGLIQSGFDVLMPMRSNGLILPSAALSPTILDSLVA